MRKPLLRRHRDVRSVAHARTSVLHQVYSAEYADLQAVTVRHRRIGISRVRRRHQGDDLWVERPLSADAAIVQKRDDEPRQVGGIGEDRGRRPRRGVVGRRSRDVWRATGGVMSLRQRPRHRYGGP